MTNPNAAETGMPRLHTRRQFLHQSTVLAASACSTLALADSAVRRNTGPLRVAIAGCAADSGSLAHEVRESGAELVAYCGLGEVQATVAALHPSAKTFADPQTMIESASFDALIVNESCTRGEATTRLALERGLHVHTSLVGRSIAEARELGDLARRFAAATQANLRSGNPELVDQIAKPLQSGAIGRIREVVCWSRSVSPLEFQVHGNLILAVPMHVLGLGHPTSIFAAGTTPPGNEFPSGMAVRYQFPAKGRRPALRVTWYNGEWAPPYESIDGVPLSDFGTLYQGATGHLLDDLGNTRATLLLDGRSPRELPAVATHAHQSLRNWLAACQGRPRALSGLEHAAVLNQTVLAGLVAYRMQQPLKWDGPGMRAYNCPQADALIRPTLDSIQSV